jgi:hypothetical protein
MSTVDPFKLAGKKTLGNLFSKVKAKVQELDQGRCAHPSLYLNVFLFVM